MKRFPIIPALGVTYCLLAGSLAFSAPHPRDSVIIESKTVNPGTGHPAVFVRVLITNKDTLAGYSFPFAERSLTGGAYLTFGSRTFSGAIHRLDSCLNFLTIFAGNRYNYVSPDTFTVAGYFNPADFATAEPPNVVRKAFLEIKFDTVRSNLGTVALDSAFIQQPNGFINDLSFYDLQGNSVKVNFVKGTITVEAPEPPCALARLNLKDDGVLDLADVVALINCVFLGEGDCKGVYTAADVVILLNAIFSGASPPPGEC